MTFKTATLRNDNNFIKRQTSTITKPQIVPLINDNTDWYMDSVIQDMMIKSFKEQVSITNRTSSSKRVNNNNNDWYMDESIQTLLMNSVQENTSIIKASKPIPLTNNNNNCYMNSAIQVMLIPFLDLSDYLKSQLTSKKIIVPEKSFHALSLMKHFTLSFEKQQEFSIYNFLKGNCELKYFGSELTWNKQEDAQEFLNNFLNKLEEEVKPFIGNEALPFQINRDVRLFCDNCQHTKASQPNIVNENMLFINIDGNSEMDEMIVNCIRNKVEGYKCPSCNSINGRGRNCEIFSNSPKYLIVCIKRFVRNPISLAINKLNEEMKIDDKFELLYGNDDNVNISGYELIGVVNHVGGTISCGHYYSFVKYKDQWYKTNDQRITTVSFEEMKKEVKSSNYINVYKKIY